MDGRLAPEGTKADLKNLLEELGQLHERAKKAAAQQQDQPRSSDGSIVMRGR